MATTSQCLTWIELECHGWQREGTRGTRALFNEAHKMLLQQQCEQNIVWDDSLGNLPFIVTTAGTYKYLCPTTVWRVGAVVLDYETTLDYGSLIDQDLRLDDIIIGGITYRKLRNLRTKDWDRREAAWVMFHGYDPGDTTTTFRRLAYKRASEITSDSVQHEMPGTTDQEYLMPATIMLIQAINDHSKYAEARKYILDVLKPQLWGTLDGGEQGQSDFCVKRDY